MSQSNGMPSQIKLKRPGRTRRSKRLLSRTPTLRQQAFIGAYLSGPPGVRGNAKAAAESVGYSARNTASGTHLLAVPAVKAALEKHLAKADVTVDRVLGELAAIGFADLRDVVEWGRPALEPAAQPAEGGEQPPADASSVRVRSSREISDTAARAISEIAETEHGVRVKLHDKIRAVELLGKYLKIFGPTHGEGEGSGGTTNVFNTQINVTTLGGMSDEELEILERATARLSA